MLTDIRGHETLLHHHQHLSLFAFFFSLALEIIFIKAHPTESSCVTGPENVLFLKQVCESFSPEILLAGAVKELGYVRS